MVFLEIQVEPGESVAAGQAIASVESVKASAEIYAPVAGKVLEINKALPQKPETLNSDPYEAGWMVKIEAANPNDLMDAAPTRSTAPTARTKAWPVPAASRPRRATA